MALAQDLFPTQADDAHDVGPREGQRRSGPVRVRKTAESGANSVSEQGEPQEEARLARMVRELRALEDDIRAKMAAAERLLAQLASRGTHEDGGYGSWGEFEERMLAASPMLRAMRVAATTRASAVHKTHRGTKRESADARVRGTKALTSIARAFDQMRGLGTDIQRCASEAQAKLRAIEVMRVYEECGYTSFEEFLERALGPSPVLASAVALAACEPVAEQPTEQSPVDVGSDVGSDPGDLFSTPFTESPDSSTGGATTAAAFDDPAGTKHEAVASEARTPTETAKSRGRNRRAMILSILCVAASIGGAAAGVGSALVTAKQPLPESVASIAIAPVRVAEPLRAISGESAAKTPAIPSARPAADPHSSQR